MYKDSLTKIDIICNQHGVFSQAPASHMRGTGCPKCYVRNRRKKYNTETFVNVCQKIHGAKYEYSKTYYTGSLQSVIVICHAHGEFKIQAWSHSTGTGCKNCAWQEQCNSQIVFEDRANKIHNYKYDYSKSVYTKSKEKITITCPEHGDFIQSAASHITGSGCTSCSKGGFFANDPATLYVFVCNDLVKIGISKDARKRIADIRTGSGLDFKLLKQYNFTEGRIAYKFEQDILSQLRTIYKQPQRKFEGYTECFIDVDKIQLLNLIQVMLDSDQYIGYTPYIDSATSEAH